MNRSALLVIAYLGCLKAGLAYMPLEKGSPHDRLHAMVASSGCRLVLSSGTCPLLDTIHCVDLSCNQDIFTKTAKQTLPNVNEGQLCNLMFTSGSTGVPKGVMIEHRGMVNLCDPGTSNWPDRLRSGFTTRIGFDPSGYQIFAPLLNGSELHILPDMEVFDPEAFRRFIVDHGAYFVYNVAT